MGSGERIFFIYSEFAKNERSLQRENQNYSLIFVQENNQEYTGIWQYEMKNPVLAMKELIKYGLKEKSSISIIYPLYDCY